MASPRIRVRFKRMETDAELMERIFVKARICMLLRPSQTADQLADEWGLERRIIKGGGVTVAQDEADACEVARDMVLEGRLDEARALLEQAPNRLARKCPACGAWPGLRCKTMPIPDGAQRCSCPPFASSDDIAAAPKPGQECPGCGAATEYLFVPHHARLVGHSEAGPLFDQRETTTCAGCGADIDPDVCHCGTDVKNHTIDDGHFPVPMGCDFHRDVGPLLGGEA